MTIIFQTHIKIITRNFKPVQIPFLINGSQKGANSTFDKQTILIPNNGKSIVAEMDHLD